MRPSSVAELANLVRSRDHLAIPLWGGEGLSFVGLKGEIRHDVADGVVSCLAGTTLGELNEKLAGDGRCLPHGSVWPPHAEDLPLAVLLLLGLPHAAEAARGTWRDWILGATMVTADGTVVKAGSRVVKSVAGYDAHKLLIGSRGSLVLPAEFHFRTFHVSMAPAPVPGLRAEVRSILRVLPSDHAATLAALGEQRLFDDPATGTIWSTCPVGELPPLGQGWAMDPLLPEIEAKTLALHRRAKATLDPTNKLAPVAFANL
jgi:FAD/FMN-containing dehydrogenase